MELESPSSPYDKLTFNYLVQLPRIARVSSGVVSKYRDGEVIERPYGGPDEDRNHSIEKRVYERLGQHERIVRVLAFLPPEGIVMDEMKEPLCLRLKYLREHNMSASPEQVKKWTVQMAKRLQYIHGKNIMQADIGSQNLLLDANDNLKFVDFAGSSIDGEEAYVCAGAREQAPEFWTRHPSAKDEIFAMGSIFHEIATCRKPYDDKEDHVVEKLYAAVEFPETGDLLIGQVIQKCWRMQYEHVAEVVQDLGQLYYLGNNMQGMYFSLFC